MEFFLENVFEIDDDDIIIALFEQGLDTIDGYNNLELEDIPRVCNNIRKPGGMMVDEDGDMVPNRGTPISVLIEARLKMLWLYCRYCNITQREPDFDDDEDIPTLEALADLNSWLKSFPDSKNVKEPPQFPGQQKAKKWFETVDEWAARTKGPSGFPLAYVLREQHAIPAEDEGWFEPSIDEDLFNRGQHPVPGTAAPHWRGDNTMVWNMLKQTIHPTKEFTWIKSFERAKNGNAAYWAMKHVMMGPGVTRAIRAEADKIIQNTKYDGKAKGFAFDKMVTALAQAFIDSEIQWTEERKVQKLLNAITDSSLIAAKHAIMASTTLRDSYQDSVNYLQELVAIRDQHPGTSSLHTVAAIESSGDDASNNDGTEGNDDHPSPLEEWDPSQPGAYYSSKAYAKLTPEQKELHAKANEGDSSTEKKATGRKGKRDSSKISDLIAIQNEQAAQIAKLISDLDAARAVAEHQGTVSIGATISNKRRPGIAANPDTSLYKREENGDFTRVF